MKSTDREPGYYWVKFAGEWQPAQLRGSSISHHTYKSWWSIIDSDNYYYDEDFDEIGPAIILP